MYFVSSPKYAIGTEVSPGCILSAIDTELDRWILPGVSGLDARNKWVPKINILQRRSQYTQSTNHEHVFTF